MCVSVFVYALNAVGVCQFKPHSGSVASDDKLKNIFSYFFKHLSCFTYTLGAFHVMTCLVLFLFYNNILTHLEVVNGVSV